MSGVSHALAGFFGGLLVLGTVYLLQPHYEYLAREAIERVETRIAAEAARIIADREAAAKRGKK